MACDSWRDAISAVADGEDPGIEVQLVTRHVNTCASCAEFERDVAATRGALRLGEAEAVPDLSRRVVKDNAVADRSGRWALVRLTLALVAAQIAVEAIPALLLGDQTGTSPHGARHVGAFSVAYAVGLLVVVMRPARARALLPVAQVLIGAIAISTAVDVFEGSVGLADELVHLPELISLVLLWATAVPTRPRQRGGRRMRALTITQAESGRAASQ